MFSKILTGKTLNGSQPKFSSVYFFKASHEQTLPQNTKKSQLRKLLKPNREHINKFYSCLCIYSHIYPRFTKLNKIKFRKITDTPRKFPCEQIKFLCNAHFLERVLEPPPKKQKISYCKIFILNKTIRKLLKNSFKDP